MPCNSSDGMGQNYDGDAHRKISDLEDKFCKMASMDVNHYVTHRIGDLTYVIQKCIETKDEHTLLALVNLGTAGFIWSRDYANQICQRYLKP